jgi:hypothetical protein
MGLGVPTGLQVQLSIRSIAKSITDGKKIFLENLKKMCAILKVLGLLYSRGTISADGSGLTTLFLQLSFHNWEFA